MLVTRPFVLPVDGDRGLEGLLTLPTKDGPCPAVIVCHGFKGFMEWGFFPFLAELLAARGLAVVRFNFRGNGMRPGDELVTDPAAFRSATFSRDLDDLLAVLAAIERGELAPGRIDPGRLGLLGHSRGGGTAVLAAAGPAWRERLRALVTWAAVASFDRLSAEEKRAWRETGEIEVVNARTGQRLPVDVAVLDDLEEHHQRLDPLAAAGERRCPWLVIHGETDESVPAGEGRALAARAAPPSELLLIPAGSHTFGARHPFDGPSAQLIQALNATQAWFRRHLG